MNQLRLETVLISSLSLDPSNARKHDAKNLASIAGSLKLFGQRKPIVVSGANVVVAGNGTLEAAKSLGWSEISVVRIPNDWTAEQVKAYALADNRTAELAEWDAKVLAEQLIELDAVGWDVSEFGFEPMNPTGDLDDDDEPLSFDEDKPTRSKLGDIWQLGKHKILCGDSFDKATIERLLDKEKVQLVFTDPPYGMDLDTDYSKMGTTTTSYDKIQNDDKPFDAESIMSLINCPVWYIWGADYFPSTIKKWSQGSVIVWAKAHSEDENKVFGSSFEICWRYPKAKKEVWFVRRIFMTDEHIKAHPTQKPIELGTRAILKETNENDLVFDFFLGSGSTLIGAEKTNRRCYGVELEPKYCDVIIERWERLTGLTATRLEQ
jgi:DNA modification methylase